MISSGYKGKIREVLPMGVRNCADLGTNFIKIVRRLMDNEDLMKLLYYTDKDPLSQPNLTNEQKMEYVYKKLVKFVPRVGPREVENPIVSIRMVSGREDASNNQFKNVAISVETFCPLEQWIIKGENLRPFAIMGEIQRSLNGKTIDGLGKMIGGDFDLQFLTDEISCYEQTFSLTSYD